jgi:AraC family transcriptional activator of pobA
LPFDPLLNMKEKEIRFLELSDSPYGMLVARMLPENITKEVKDDIASPHRHDYYALILLETGEANLIVDFQSVDLKSATMLLLRPGQVHQTNAGNNVSGWIMFFNGQIVDQNARLAIEQSLQNIILLNLAQEDMPGLNQLLSSIRAAIEEEQPGRFHKQFLQSLLNAFFYKTMDILYLQEAGSIGTHPTRAVEIARNFNQMVKEHYRTMKRPADYAEEMNITVSYLNDTLKAVTGFSSTHIIQQEIIGEAQRLLFYTSKSVKEIAFELGYHDYKYFIRQFGNLTHTTPLSFRRETAVRRQNIK